MLTFSEALTHLKLGEDMRQVSWPRNVFVRAAPAPIPIGSKQLLKMSANGAPTVRYVPTDDELFNQNWVRA